MSPTNTSPLLVRSVDDADEYINVNPITAGWDLIHFSARRMASRSRWDYDTGENELALVILGGQCSIRSNRGDWPILGKRADVFSGMPYTVYLPRRTNFTVEALSDQIDIAYGWCATDEDHPPRVVKPEEVKVEIRGGENATRQINSMLPPGFDCHRLVVVEVYTPSGNWSSYPPHKHDVHRVDAEGLLLEADLEEVYFYKINKPGGYAYQRVYTGDGKLDELVMARNNDVVLVPEGYHPVVSAHGYTTYYLNFLAGSAQSLANSDDPEYSWVKEGWKEQDPRLPVVTL